MSLSLHRNVEEIYEGQCFLGKRVNFYKFSKGIFFFLGLGGVATDHPPVPSSSTMSASGEKKAEQGKQNYKFRSQKLIKFQKENVVL